ncbi:hypothetical protein ZIOFF_038648 [Zingiber officinale]|uniref:Retroviral polymerase SH3-like domain-containing protein n=1 Tax=Zingiber officinale TaxID=94328 RepID=A0A8J5KZL9_ZINOF|nr:hypothetical protein ZIOFF_038648 [Zingiber officinale]
MNHPEEVLNEEGPLHGEEELVVLLTPIGTLKIRMTEMKDMDMEEAIVEAEVMVVDEVETLDGGMIKLNLNVSPKRIGDITPEEAWSLRKPKVDHLHIFGSIAYVKIQEENRTKLEDKSQKCIILGYCENASGYKLYNPITQKLVVSRDVEFDAEQTWNWNNNNNDDMKQISFEEDYKEKEDKQGEEVSSPQQVDTQSESDDSNSPIVKKMKSIQDIYDSSQAIDDLRLQQEATTKIYVDNKSAIALAKNLVHHERSKHIDTRFHFIREYVKSKEIELLYVKSSDQVADILTKPLKVEAFQYLRNSLGVQGRTSLRGADVGI